MVSGFARMALAVALGGFAAQCQANCGPAYGADGIAEDAAGNVWFTHYEDARIGTFAAATGKFTEFLPTLRANPEVTTRKKGSAGKEKFDYSYDSGYSGIGIDRKRKYLWTFRWNSNTLTRFSLKEKQFAEFELPGRPFARGTINLDPQGHLWVLTSDLDKAQRPTQASVAEIAPDGKVLRQIALPHPAYAAYALALDRQGRLWLAQSSAEADARAELYVLEGGKFVGRPVSGLGRLVNSMAFDAAGNLWLTEHGTQAIYKYADGKLTAIPLPATSGSPGGAVVDGRGDLWITEHLGDNRPGKIGRLSSDGALKEFAVPPENDWVVTMTPAQDGGIWFSTILNYNLFHLDPATGQMREYAVPVPANWSEDAAARSSTCKIGNRVVTEPVAAEPALRHPRGFADNPSAALFEKRCTECHSWYRVDKVAARRSDWTATVDRMIRVNGAKSITAEDRGRIIQYLNGNYSMNAGK